MKTLEDETLAQVAGFLRAMGELNRLRILRALHGAERTVTEIVEETGCSQSNVSKHLGVLARARLVRFRKEGKAICYRLADPNVSSICASVCRSIAEKIRGEALLLKDLRRGGRG